MRTGRWTLHLGAVDVLLVVVGVVAGLACGLLGGYSATLGLAAAFVAAGVVAGLLRPVAIAILALVGMFAVQRLGGTSTAAGSSGGVSYADALLALAALTSVPGLLGRIEFRRLWIPLCGLAVYLTALLPSVVLNATERGYQEWVHRLFLVGGALLVGAWITREGAVRVALRAVTAVGCALAVLSVVEAVSSGFSPAEPLGLNKNFVGAQLGALLVLVAVGGRYLELPSRLRVTTVVVLAAGLLASQSRGAMLAAGAGLLIPVVLDPRNRSRVSKMFVAVLAVALGVVVYVSVVGELHQTQQNFQNSSLGVRINVERETRAIWHTSPIYGVGLKYFNSGDYGYYAQAANNDIDNELAESGVIGLAGFIVLQLSVVVAGFSRRRANGLVAAGVAVVVGQLVHGLFDIYWTAGVVPLPFIVLGMALALDDRRRPGAQQVQDAGNSSLSTAERTRSLA